MILPKPYIWSKRELKRVALEFRNGLIGKAPSDGRCMMVCWPLHGYLELFGVLSKVIEADFGRTNHVWLELENGEILDPTADQFSGEYVKLPKVYVGPLPEIYKRWMEKAKARPYPSLITNNY